MLRMWMYVVKTKHIYSHEAPLPKMRPRIVFLYSNYRQTWVHGLAFTIYSSSNVICGHGTIDIMIVQNRPTAMKDDFIETHTSAWGARKPNTDILLVSSCLRSIQIDAFTLSLLISRSRPYSVTSSPCSFRGKHNRKLIFDEKALTVNAKCVVSVHSQRRLAENPIDHPTLSAERRRWEFLHVYEHSSRLTARPKTYADNRSCVGDMCCEQEDLSVSSETDSTTTTLSKQKLFSQFGRLILCRRCVNTVSLPNLPFIEECRGSSGSVSANLASHSDQGCLSEYETSNGGGFICTHCQPGNVLVRLSALFLTDFNHDSDGFTFLRHILFLTRNTKALTGLLYKNGARKPTKIEEELQKYVVRTLKAKESPIHGTGVFAMQDLQAFQIIAEYPGIVLSREDADRKELLYRSQLCDTTYMYKLPDGHVLDATTSTGVARYLNHSCEPNVRASSMLVSDEYRVTFHTLRHVKKGEELLIDYMFPFEPEENKIPCLCTSKSCHLFLNYQVPRSASQNQHH